MAGRPPPADFAPAPVPQVGSLENRLSEDISRSPSTVSITYSPLERSMERAQNSEAGSDYTQLPASLSDRHDSGTPVEMRVVVLLNTQPFISQWSTDEAA